MSPEEQAFVDSYRSFVRLSADMLASDPRTFPKEQWVQLHGRLIEQMAKLPSEKRPELRERVREEFRSSMPTEQWERYQLLSWAFDHLMHAARGG